MITINVSAFESSSGWMTARALFEGMDPAAYAGDVIQAIVDNGQLSQYASSVAERDFVTRSLVQALHPPQYSVDVSGYDDGNELISLPVLPS